MVQSQFPDFHFNVDYNSILWSDLYFIPKAVNALEYPDWGDNWSHGANYCLGCDRKSVDMDPGPDGSYNIVVVSTTFLFIVIALQR